MSEPRKARLAKLNARAAASTPCPHGVHIDFTPCQVCEPQRFEAEVHLHDDDPTKRRSVGAAPEQQGIMGRPPVEAGAVTVDEAREIVQPATSWYGTKAFNVCTHLAFDDSETATDLRSELAALRAQTEAAEAALQEIHKITGRGEGHWTMAATAACIIDSVLSMKEKPDVDYEAWYHEMNDAIHAASTTLDPMPENGVAAVQRLVEDRDFWDRKAGTEHARANALEKVVAAKIADLARLQAKYEELENKYERDADQTDGIVDFYGKQVTALQEKVEAYDKALDDMGQRVIWYTDIDGPVLHQECRDHVVRHIRAAVDHKGPLPWTPRGFSKPAPEPALGPTESAERTRVLGLIKKWVTSEEQAARDCMKHNGNSTSVYFEHLAVLQVLSYLAIDVQTGEKP